MRFGQPVPPEPEVADEAAPVLQLFFKLSKRRQQGQSGPQPLTYGELESYTRLSLHKFSPAVIDLLAEMDDAFLSAVSNERSEMIERKQNKIKATQAQNKGRRR